MSFFGLAANARNAMPDRLELAALGMTRSWLRTIVYDLDSLDVALHTIEPSTQVCAILNSETQNYEEWAKLCGAVAQRFSGRVQGVEILNEADLLGIPVETAARLTITASPILRSVGMKVILSSVAGPDWPNYLSRLATATRGYADYANLHGYGQRVNGFPTNWGFGELSDAIKTANDVSGLPVVLTEQGIKIGDAGGEEGQAEYVRRLGALLQTTPVKSCPFACYFAWRDDVGAPSERGNAAFGLRHENGRTRPAWYAFADAPKEPVVPPVPQPKTYSVGPAIALRMEQYHDTAASNEDYWPTPKDWTYSEAWGMSNRRYVYLKATKMILTFDPTAWVSEDELMNPKPKPQGALRHFTPEQIANTLSAPLANVQAQWPLLAAALDEQGLSDRPTVIAALATVGVESGSFLSIEEYRNLDGTIPDYWHNYGGGANYHGRGLIQLTHDYNYKHYGDALGVDLLHNPTMALDPVISARIFALYFKEHGIQTLAQSNLWIDVRRAVNGGTNGLTRFLTLVDALVALP